jgi:uncharacterized membrane protein YeaQ/YmgE (transglycosylase-associated protein family)
LSKIEIRGMLASCERGRDQDFVNPRGLGLMLDNAVGIAGAIVGGFVFREFGAAGISRIRRKVVASCGQIGDTSMANNGSPPFRPEQIVWVPVWRSRRQAAPGCTYSRCTGTSF